MTILEARATCACGHPHPCELHAPELFPRPFAPPPPPVPVAPDGARCACGALIPCDDHQTRGLTFAALVELVGLADARVIEARIDALWPEYHQRAGRAGARHGGHGGRWPGADQLRALPWLLTAVEGR